MRMLALMAFGLEDVEQVDSCTGRETNTLRKPSGSCSVAAETNRYAPAVPCGHNARAPKLAAPPAGMSMPRFWKSAAKSPTASPGGATASGDNIFWKAASLTLPIITGSNGHGGGGCGTSKSRIT